jgi:hypothetical protein
MQLADPAWVLGGLKFSLPRWITIDRSGDERGIIERK